MTKIDDLKKLVNDFFEKAEKKEEIEAFAQINSKIDEIEKETTNLEDNQKELLKNYKEALIHQSFKKESSEQELGVNNFDADKTLIELINKNALK